MAEDKRRVNAAIDLSLYENVMKMGYSISEAITLGLEKLLEPVREENESNIRTIARDVLEAKDSLIQSLEVHTNDLNKRIESLDEQLKAKDTGYQSIIENLEEQLKAKDDGFRERIEDFKEQLKIKDSQLEIIDSRMGDRVKSLEEQLRVKDQQLDKQAFSLQSVIQENSRLNVKLLPESTEIKVKPWWRFW
jgi:hypothetical protein